MVQSTVFFFKRRSRLFSLPRLASAGLLPSSCTQMDFASPAFSALQEDEVDEDEVDFSVCLASPSQASCLRPAKNVLEATSRLLAPLGFPVPHRLEVVYAPVAASNWYPTLTCGSAKLDSSQQPHPQQQSQPAG
ncbi:unnamed protein product [Schistocephalus solidus]|uniref:Nfu_N domain-containing protein n=1 Tax=Schistocephalus solidus TaxID=70667 RepID=A0A183SHW3_SCHSO|nr:unnamed protein product [Schistocephalus solidus]